MPSETNSYAFCADYSSIADCLFAIQASEENGAFAADAEALRLIRLFENDVLRKLYLRTIRILGILEGIEEVTKSYFRGDFSVRDLSDRDFHVGYLLPDGYGGISPSYYLLGDFDGRSFYEQDFNVGGYLLGDFEDIDFTYLDFHVGYLDTRNSGYSSTFQTILNIFREFCSRSAEISDADKAALNAALIPVLDAFEDLQEYLISKGLNPCTAADTVFLNNTPGVYLQAAGADGADGIAEGLHLRWSLTDELGTNHLPKGDYDNSPVQNTGFNQPNDYIQLSRTPYLNPVRIAIDLAMDKPVIDFNAKRWTYIINQTVNGQLLSNRIRLTFIDVALYNLLAVTVNPANVPFDFLKQYNGVVELEVTDKAIFTVGFDFRKPDAAGSAVLKAEAICEMTSLNAPQDMTIRKTFVLDGTVATTAILRGDNIRAVRLKKSADSFLQGFYVESYHDFLITRNTADWTAVGNGFGLSLTDLEVYDRLENTAYPIDDRWPQYNNGTRVRIANYKDKWATSRPNEPSLKEAVTRYLALSETDPRAEDVLRDEGSSIETPGLLISYLDMLCLQAMDYHMARMLGLAHIDVLPGVGVNDEFIYRLTYRNRKSLNSAEMADYRYSSLPISKANKLLPEKPVMRPVTYALPVTDQQINNVFDSQGYTKLDNIRIVNIGRELSNDEIPGDDFFANLSLIENNNVFENPKPVFYGIEYRPASQSGYVKPEITHEKASGRQYNAYDTDYPVTGIPETVPVPDNLTSLYIHFERQAGVHFYAIYGINWFSRASVISDEVVTDATAFPVKNSLNPPTDVAVQYIQKEDPLLFTTTIEQTWLNGRILTFPGQDIGLTRVTFNWLDIEDASGLEDTSAQQLTTLVKPDKVNAFFKPGLPLEITGVISNILAVPGSETQLFLHIDGYTLIDGTVVNPAIAGEDFFRFNGSLLSTPDGQFQVVHVDAGTGWPVITIEKAYDVRVIEDSAQPGIYGTQKFYSAPETDSRFSMVENLSNQVNWHPVIENVSLVSFADPENPDIESSADSEGNVTKLWIGGITGDAIVTPLFTAEDTPEDMPGYYRVSFNPSVVLQPHPQVNLPFDPAFPEKNAPGVLREAHVEWYKGWVRMSPADSSADKKLLEVLRIDQTDPLVLYIYDPGYLDNPIISSATPADPVLVNFHPGYRVYLFPEPTPDYTLNRDYILPADDSNDRKTLLGLQTADTRPGGSGFVSSVSVPSVLLARRIEEPVQFGAPIASSLKVRPDATGKAALTFDVRIAPASSGLLRKPFGFLFYRTSVDDVFDTLYTPSTVAQILTNLASLTADPSYNQRIYEMVNLLFDPEHPMQFRVFDAEPQPYGLPVPDRAGLVAEGDSDVVKLNKYKGAIHETLLPLTEQPPVYTFIKEGFQTENELPVIRDIDGNLLGVLDPAFNPFPMVRKYSVAEDPNATYIRFTDYTLNGSSRNLYFYAGTEITNQLITGELSLFTGPVTILHTMPSDAPSVSRFSIQPSVIDTDSGSVVFQITPISVEEHISRIKIYRTIDPLKATALQTMESSFEVEIEEGLLTGYEITDTFADLPFAPLGETLYYRFAGVRTIINEIEEPEDVFSYGSAVIPVRLIDTLNPDAPDIIYDAILNKLNWLPTTNKGTYYLYQQNVKGNWARIYTVEPPASGQEMSYEFPAPLVFEDEEDNRIYYRFKVQVQNSSGLFNLVEKEITI